MVSYTSSGKKKERRKQRLHMCYLAQGTRQIGGNSENKLKILRCYMDDFKEAATVMNLIGMLWKLVTMNEKNISKILIL